MENTRIHEEQQQEDEEEDNTVGWAIFSKRCPMVALARVVGLGFLCVLGVLGLLLRLRKRRTRRAKRLLFCCNFCWASLTFLRTVCSTSSGDNLAQSAFTILMALWTDQRARN